MPAKKKPRWTTSQKNTAKKSNPKGPKKAHHRGQAPTDAPPRSKDRWRERDDATGGERPKRVRRDGTEDHGQRGWERREDRGGFQRREDRGGYQGQRRDSQGDDRRGGYQRRDDRNDDRGGFQRREDRGGYQGQRRDSQGDDRRGGYQRRDDRSEDRGGFQRRSGSEDRRRGPAPRFDREQTGGRPARWQRDGDDARRGSAPRFEREQNRRGFAPRHDQTEDPEALRQEADTWTSSARSSVSGPVEVAQDNGFAALGVPDVLVERLAREGITTPFAIQEAALPDALAGKDVLGRGQTGSGKTLAFGLPMLARLSGGRARSRKPRALILVPTRELAMQVSDSLEPLVHVCGLRIKLVAGGLSYTGQTAALDKGVDVLVATPGRLVDLLDRGALTLDEVEVAVLDEADHMADMGFLPSVTRILDDCAPGGQRLLFSATLDRGVSDLVDRYMTDPVTHNTNDVGASVTTMDHHLLLIEPQLKKQMTAKIAARPGRTVIFARTKLGCERIAGQLREEGIAAAPLHGGLTQSSRNKTIGAFRTGTLPVLVATDVAARGIHVDNVSLVMQVDPPADHKDYLHRAGRTARAGEKGSVVTLVLPHQRKDVTRMAAQAGLEARPIKTDLDAEVLTDIGAVEPSGQPISDADFRALVDPRPARRHSGTGGPRGARDHRGGNRGGGGRQGGYRGRPRG
ncbi:DEAD/DEAH box helicase [Janibacter limosus]|uniref:DEAD/DEAH box helicase n=1 Tax=Janibacter limosus TaxID=53458 RepID=UPI000B1A3D4C|nr:DEAD/DEAH box helicase [Janibacter limosus]